MRDLDYDLRSRPMSDVVQVAERLDWEKRVRDVRGEGRIVYFIQGIKGGPIKIGVTNDVARRLSALQNGAPDKLVVLLTAEGDREVEEEVHRKFSHLRLRGEWFEPAQELLQFIAEAKNVGRAQRGRGRGR
jgi:hypothetical protein